MTPSETRSATAPGIIPEPAAACCVAHTRANTASRGMTKSSTNTTRTACARKRPACSTMFYNKATGGTGYQSTFYTFHDKNIVHMTNASNKLHFFYDAQNKPAVAIFNGTAYAYLYNLQDDVIG